MLGDYETTGDLPPLSGVRARPTPTTPDARASARTVPEGHTLHRLAGALVDAFAGRPSRRRARRAGSPTEAAELDGEPLLGRRRVGQAPVRGLPGRAARARPPRALRQLRRPPLRHGAGRRGARSGRAGPAAAGGRRPPAARRGPTCGRHRPAPSSPPPSATRSSPARGPTRCAPTPTRRAAWERVRRSRAPIGGLLMQQAVLAGVGNVYRAEVLFRHRMHPLRPGRTLRSGQFRALWDDLVVLMAEGVRTGRIDTVRPEHTPGAMGRPPARGRPRRRGLRLPPPRAAVPGLRVAGAHRRAARAQPLLVPALSAQPSGRGPYSEDTAPRVRTPA